MHLCSAVCSRCTIKIFPVDDDDGDYNDDRNDDEQKQERIFVLGYTLGFLCLYS